MPGVRAISSRARASARAAVGAAYERIAAASAPARAPFWTASCMANARARSAPPMRMKTRIGRVRASSTTLWPRSPRMKNINAARITSGQACSGDIGVGSQYQSAPPEVIPASVRGGHRLTCAREHFRDDAESAVDVFARDIDMGDRPQARRITEVAREPHAPLRAGLLEGPGIHPGRVDLERDDVRRDLRGVDADTAHVREAVRERAS